MKIILFELNEVPPRILDAFCQTYPDSTFARMLPLSVRADTVNEDNVPLSPWITWPTLHRGVTHERHGIGHLGQPIDAANKAYPSLWAIAAEAGARVGVGGSLHSYPVPERSGNYDFYLPDTFAPDSQAIPASLEAFQAFNLAMVSESARNVSTKINMGIAAGMLPHLPALGFGAGTAGAVLKQLLSERVRIERKVRRRTLQAELAFDAFMAHLGAAKPALATFFTNHVASAMHRFWGAAYPQEFEKLDYDQTWIKSFGAEIDAAMIAADRMLRRLKRFVDSRSDYALVVASSMGQAACSGVAMLNQLAISDLQKFLAVAGVPADTWVRRPAMHPHYSFEVRPEHAAAFEAGLQRMTQALSRMTADKDYTDISYERRGDFFHLALDVYNLDAGRARLPLGDGFLPLADAGLGLMETDFQQGCTGYHVPEGVLLVYGVGFAPKNMGEMSTCDIAPSILAMMDIARPGHMRKPVSF